MTSDDNTALNDVRVLDLTEDRGLYAGKLLADLGADVIKVEKPAGSRARGIGPFKDDVPGAENSLYFLYFNTNKRGITLNLEMAEGQALFKRLVKQSDVVIEDFPLGRLKALGLDYPALKEINPGIIMASLTAFGQEGPYAGFQATDIVSCAMGGLMYVNGPEDAAPVVAPCEQTYHSVSALAAFTINAALFLRMRTGEGQLLDLSAHEIMTTITGNIVMYSNTAQISKRSGSQFGAVPGKIYPCKDGYIHILTIRPNHWRGLLEVMGNPEKLMGNEFLAGNVRNANVDLIDAHVIAFTMEHAKMEIAERCQEKGVPCTPVNTLADFYQDPHIRQRGFFIEMEHPVIGRYMYPGPGFRLTRTPSRIRRTAPLLGQHNRDVYCRELGYAGAELENLKTRGII